MATARLEHVNLTVTDIERTSTLLQRLCGWLERWRGPAMAGGETIHVGTDDAYVALYTNPAAVGGHAKGAPLNHVALLVDDLDEAERVLVEAGLEPFSHGDYHPGRRFYVLDWDGIEWELVSYA